MRFLGVVFFCAILVCSFAGKAVADEVYLKNGDRITGKVITMEKGKLTIETTYAGKIQINWAELSELKADTRITVILSDGTSLQGIPTPAEDGGMKLKTEILTEPVSFNMVEVKAVNPKIVPTVRLTARVNFGAKVEGGNTDKTEFHLDGSLVARSEKNRFTAGLEMDRDESDGERNENKWLAYTKYDHFLTDKWYLDANTSFEKDDFKDISSRTVLGLGPGYQYWHSDVRNLSSELGYAYIAESFSDDTDDNDYSALRWAVTFDYYLYKKIVQLFHWDEAFYSLDDSEDIWLRSRTGFRFPIYKGLTWTVQYNVDWDNSPTPGKDKVDTTLLFTLGYQFTE